MAQVQGKVLFPETQFFDITSKDVLLDEKNKVIEIHGADLDELKILKKQIIESNTKAASYELLVKNLTLFVTRLIKSETTPVKRKKMIDLGVAINNLIEISDGNNTEKSLEESN